MKSKHNICGRTMYNILRKIVITNEKLPETWTQMSVSSMRENVVS